MGYMGTGLKCRQGKGTARHYDRIWVTGKPVLESYEMKRFSVG